MKILVAGDFCPTERLKPIVESGDYHSIFCEVEPIIKSADYSIVNYECPAVLGDYPPIAKCGPNLSSSSKGIEAIKYAGFNIATLANNHIMDFGAQGLMDTVNLCSQYNIDTVGVGKNLEDASKILYKRKDGETLAIINCCEHEFSIAGDDSAGANPLNPIQQYYKIKEARLNADYVLVIVHGGHEMYQQPSLRMVETYRFFIDAGANAVVNHHQHCFSGYEFYKRKPIIYGLGNFCFDASHRNSIWNEGYLAVIDFQQKIIDIRTIPYIQNNKNVGIYPIKDQASFNDKIYKLNQTINNKAKLQEEQKTYYGLSRDEIKLRFEPYTNRIMKGLRRRHLIPSFLSEKKQVEMLNMVDCESHRDKLLYALKNHNRIN